MDVVRHELPALQPCSRVCRARQTERTRRGLVKQVRAALIPGIQLPYYTVPLFRFLVLSQRESRYHTAAIVRFVVLLCPVILSMKRARSTILPSA